MAFRSGDDVVCDVDEGICKGGAMGESVLLRSRGGQALGAAMVLLAVVGLGVALVDGVEELLRFGAPVALFGLLGWGSFWRPHVEVTDGGVTVANTLRTIEVPWPAVTDVDGRYGLRLTTAYGPVTAWGAAAPMGRQRARREDSPAAVVVRERWEALRTAGYLDDARLERPAPRTTWHRPLIAGLAALALASAVLPLLA